MLLRVLANYPYLVAVVLFAIGFYTVLARSNLIKKIIGINIVQSATFLFFIASGNLRSGTPPIVEPGVAATYVNPLPTALMLTGIVVSVSVTAFALALAVKLYGYYGTLDPDRIAQLRTHRQ
ncbi:MAG: cation:proton antiporter subunit C [bacterium]|nr:cation:proton antiporter subunit C [bacterium]